MYQTITTSQEKHQIISQIPTGYVFNKEYMARCTPTQRKILLYLLRFKYAEWFCISRAKIAEMCGCTTRTVTTALSKFHADMVVFRNQKHPRAFNDFTYGPLCFIPETKIDHKNKKIFSVCYFHPNRSLSINLDLSNSNVDYRSSKETKIIRSNSRSSIVANTNTRAHEKVGQRRKINVTVKKDRLMSNEISNEKKQEETKTLHQLIIANLSLKSPNMYKLMVFPNEVLRWAYKEHKSLQQRKRRFGKPIGIGMFFVLCKDYCKKNNITLDWSLYYRVCEHLNIDPHDTTSSVDENINESADVRAAASDNSKQKAIRASVGFKQEVFPIDDLIKLTEHSIEFNLQVLQDPNHPQRPKGQRAIEFGFTEDALKANITRDIKVLEELYRLKKEGVIESPRIYNTIAVEGALNATTIDKICGNV